MEYILLYQGGAGGGKKIAVEPHRHPGRCINSFFRLFHI